MRTQAHGPSAFETVGSLSLCFPILFYFCRKQVLSEKHSCFHFRCTFNTDLQFYFCSLFLFSLSLFVSVLLSHVAPGRFSACRTTPGTGSVLLIKWRSHTVWFSSLVFDHGFLIALLFTIEFFFFLPPLPWILTKMSPRLFLNIQYKPLSNVALGYFVIFLLVHVGYT